MSVEDAAKLVISAGLVYPEDRAGGTPATAPAASGTGGPTLRVADTPLR